MKKTIAFILAVLFMLSLTGCKQGFEHPTEKLSVEEWNATIVGACIVDYDENSSFFSEALNAEKLASEQPVYPMPIFRLDTKKDLENFITTNSKHFSSRIPAEETTPFEAAVAEYDDAFFKENSLLIVYFACGSMSYKHDVSDIYCGGKSLCVHLKHTNNPEFTVEALAGYFMIIDIADDTVKNCKYFDVEFDLSQTAEAST